MFKVHLMNPDNFKEKVDPFVGSFPSKAYQLSQFAAATCTQPSFDKANQIAQKIDVKSALFNTGHHTTLQHSDHYLTFHLDDIPVSLVTFGLHLVHPFYNTSQCSGRYCTAMFETDDNTDIKRYMYDFIERYCTDVKDNDTEQHIVDWVLRGITFYKENIDTMTKLVKEAINIERPKYPGNIDLQSRRIAQEQLRCVLSTIFPTRLVYTLNLTSLLSMYTVAWNTPMRDLLRRMVESIPGSDLAEFAKSIQPMNNSYVPDFDLSVDYTQAGLICEPSVDVAFESMAGGTPDKLFELYKGDFNDRVLDTLYFNPNTNTISQLNSDSTVRVVVEVPVSTFGQDQRHRMIKRSNPVITGNFLIPPILSKIGGAHEFCLNHMTEYLELCRDISAGDMIHFIPYGATVSYAKESDIRAYLHSVNKRLCWSAETTIAKMERMTLDQLFDDSSLKIDAPCLNDKCHEGSRYCGRSLKDRTERELI